MCLPLLFAIKPVSLRLVQSVGYTGSTGSTRCTERDSHTDVAADVHIELN